MTHLLLSQFRSKLRSTVQTLMRKAILVAGREQNLLEMYAALEEWVPDIGDERSNYAVNTDYLRASFRMLDAFQMQLALSAISSSAENQPLHVLDIGDSGGRHQLYLRHLLAGRQVNSLSVNLDERAVARIKAKGLSALCARAEDICAYGTHTDLALCFEMLEHLTDPVRFLYALSSGGKVGRLIVTVPFVRRSRVALDHLRRGIAPTERVHAENVHIFEFNPDDWELLFRHSGWRTRVKHVYLQYPKRHLLGVMRPVFSRIGHEGFVGFILEPDSSYSNIYLDW